MVKMGSHLPLGATVQLLMMAWALLGCGPCDSSEPGVCSNLNLDHAEAGFFGAQPDAFANGVMATLTLKMGGGTSEAALLVSAPGYDGPTEDEEAQGALYLLYAPLDGYFSAIDIAPDDPNAAVIYGSDLRMNFGLSAAGVGDVNGDGFGDILVGSGDNRAFLFYGPLTGTLHSDDADVIFDGDGSADYAGSVVSAAGDIDDDGLDDFMIGAQFYGSGAINDVGGVYIILGQRDLPSTYALSEAPIFFRGENLDEGLGAALAPAGDINKDGFDDLLIGAHRASTGNIIERGRVFLVFGSDKLFPTTILDHNYIQFIGERAGDNAGSSLAGSFDYDGDRIPDILIGAPGYDDYARQHDDAGAAYIILGNELTEGPLNLSQARFKLIGEASEDRAGIVTGVTDLNGDGNDEILVGAPNRDSPLPPSEPRADDVGAAYLFYGDDYLGSLPLATADIRFLGVNARDNAGYAVAGAADLMALGTASVVVGAKAADGPDGTANVGMAAIYSVHDLEAMTVSSEWIWPQVDY